MYGRPADGFPAGLVFATDSLGGSVAAVVGRRFPVAGCAEASSATPRPGIFEFAGSSPTIMPAVT
jgi:hypothetical protein